MVGAIKGWLDQVQVYNATSANGKKLRIGGTKDGDLVRISYKTLRQQGVGFVPDNTIKVPKQVFVTPGVTIRFNPPG